MKRKDYGQETSKKLAKSVPVPFKSAEDDLDLLP
jgi:hypothetical protein